MSTYKPGDEVIWHTGPGFDLHQGTITDGPFEMAERTGGMAYVVQFKHTARLLWEGALRLKKPETWAICPGEHRILSGSWEKRVKA